MTQAARAASRRLVNLATMLMPNCGEQLPMTEVHYPGIQAFIQTRFPLRTGRQVLKKRWMIYSRHAGASPELAQVQSVFNGRSLN